MKQIHSNNPGSPGHLQTYLFNFRRHSHCTNRDNFKSYQLMIVLQRRPYASGTIKERFSLQQITCFFIQLLNLCKRLYCGRNSVSGHSLQKVRQHIIRFPIWVSVILPAVIIIKIACRWFLSGVVNFSNPNNTVMTHFLPGFVRQYHVPFRVLQPPIIRHNRRHIIQRQKRVRTLKIQPTFRLR